LDGGEFSVKKTKNVGEWCKEVFEVFEMSLVKEVSKKTYNESMKAILGNILLYKHNDKIISKGNNITQDQIDQIRKALRETLNESFEARWRK
jgi:hypothetical protein